MITRTVEVTLDEVINNDFEGFLDILAERFGNTLLQDIKYKVIKNEGDTIFIEVTGYEDDE